MASQFLYGDVTVRRSRLKLCDCGCGGYPRGADYLPGHEMHVYRALIAHVGSVRNLREVVEQYTGKALDMSAVDASRGPANFLSPGDNADRFRHRKDK